jgi:hypothetical protein
MSKTKSETSRWRRALIFLSVTLLLSVKENTYGVIIVG